jgi:Ca2+-binding RTX toxin-like protein
MTFVITQRNQGENFEISPDGSTLYVAGNDGHLRVYDAATGSLLQDYPIGKNLEAIAISRDGRYAVITEGVPVSTQQSNEWTSNVTVSSVYLVDLRTGFTQTFNFTGHGSEYTFGDVAYTTDGTVLLSQNILPGWSGWEPLYTLNLSTGTFAPHGSYYSGLGSVASLTQSVTPGSALVGQLGLSSAEYFLVDSSGTRVDTNGGSYANGVNGYAGGVEAFVGSGATGRIAIVTGGGLHLYDGDFNYLGDLSDFFPNLAYSPGLTFSADGSVLYAIDPIADKIIGIAMDDYFQAETISIGNYDYSVLGMGTELYLAPNGLSFIVAANNAILHVDRPTTGIRTNGDDAITGTAQADELSGGPGNDLIQGLGGNDLLVGGSGIDSLLGGPGDDIYLVENQADLVVEEAGNGIDAVISTSNFYLYANIEILELAMGAGGLFGVGNDLGNLIFGNESANLLIGLGGNDEIHGDVGNDQIFGNDGADKLLGEAGIDYLVGGLGDDNIDGGINPDEMYGQDGNDVLSGGASFDTDILVGGSGNDSLFGDSGLGDYDRLYGNEGNDTFYVDTPADLVFEQSGEGTDTVYAGISGGGYYLYDNVENLVLTGQTPFGVGNALDNTITGNNFSNWLLGGGGGDTLDGRGGNDVLFGQSGGDTFVFGTVSGQDVIGDFQAGVDKIKLIGLFSDFATLATRFVQNGSDGAISLSTGHFIVLQGVTMANLTASDFIFAAAGEDPSTAAKLSSTMEAAARGVDSIASLDYADHGLARWLPELYDGPIYG